MGKNIKLFVAIIVACFVGAKASAPNGGSGDTLTNNFVTVGDRA